MKMKKVMTLCLATVVGMGVLSGCGSTKSEFKQYAKCAEVSVMMALNMFRHLER